MLVTADVRELAQSLMRAPECDLVPIGNCLLDALQDAGEERAHMVAYNAKDVRSSALGRIIVLQCEQGDDKFAIQLHLYLGAFAKGLPRPINVLFYIDPYPEHTYMRKFWFSVLVQ